MCWSIHLKCIISEGKKCCPAYYLKLHLALWVILKDKNGKKVMNTDKSNEHCKELTLIREWFRISEIHW